MKLTDFVFYKNTPFTDFSNTILFDSNDQRDQYFNTSFPSHSFVNMRFNFIRDRGTTQVTLLIDGIMTFCQGNTLSKFKNLSVTRKHLSRTEYNNRIVELKNNDDVIKTHTKRYTDTYDLLFNDLSVLMQVSCSLSADFGE